MKLGKLGTSYVYVVLSIRFQAFFVHHLKCHRLLKIQYVIAIHLMRWLTNFYHFTFKWTATIRIGIHHTKAWLSQLVTFKYVIWTETYGMLQTAFWPSCMNRASDFEWHKIFKKGKESVSYDDRCWRSKGINTPELIGQSHRVRVKVTMLRF